MKNSMLLLTILLTTVAFSSGQQTTWTIDPAHSTIGFKAPHMLIANVSGHFTDYSSTIKSEKNNFTDAKINVTIQANSITTGNDKRDEDLRSESFFDVKQYPTITFSGKSFKKVKDHQYTLTGDLTIKKTTKTVTLDVTYGGTTKGMNGETRAGFDINGTINRFDYGVDWSAVTDEGTFIVGEEIKLDISVELVKQ